MRLMRSSYWTLFVIVTCLVLALSLPTRVEARAREDVVSWTKEKIDEYLDKYGIQYDKKAAPSSLVKTLKSYRDTAAANAQYFGKKVDRITSAVEIQLKKNTDLSAENIDTIINDLRHRLRRLELRGELSWNSVQQAMERTRKVLLRRKILTESQWNFLLNDAESSFDSNTWFQRVLGRLPSENAIAASSVNQWLQRVAENLDELRTLSQKQLLASMDQIRHAVTSVRDHSKLGSPHWIRTLTDQLQTNAELTKEQAKQVIQAAEKDINAYKIFAMDYTGQTSKRSKNIVISAVNQLKDHCRQILDQLRYYANYVDGQLRKVWPWSHDEPTVLEKLQNAVHVRVAYPTHTPAPVASMVEEAKDSFARFWHDREKDAYRRIGYTDAHIAQIQQYLAKMFKRDHRSITQKRVDESLKTIEKYMQETRVQSSSQVQKQIDKLRQLFEAWKRSLASLTS